MALCFVPNPTVDVLTVDALADTSDTSQAITTKVNKKGNDMSNLEVDETTEQAEEMVRGVIGSNTFITIYDVDHVDMELDKRYTYTQAQALDQMRIKLLTGGKVSRKAFVKLVRVLLKP